MSSIGLPTTKEELGVKEEDIPQLANINAAGLYRWAKRNHGDLSVDGIEGSLQAPFLSIGESI